MNPITSVRQQVGVWSVLSDVIRCHPRLLVRVIERVPVQGDIGRDDEPVCVVGCHRNLHLSSGDGCLVNDNGHLLAVSD